MTRHGDVTTLPKRRIECEDFEYHPRIEWPDARLARPSD
jgi:hypothetical protein